MKKLYTILLATLLTTIAFAQNPNWTVNAASYSLDLSITAKLNFDGIMSEYAGDIVAAFDAQGNIRGTAPLVYNGTVNDYLVNLTVLSNSVNDSIFFQLYDASEDVVVASINEAILFVPNSIIGSVGSPYVIYSSNQPAAITLNNAIMNENDSIGSMVGMLHTMVPDTTGISFTYSFVSGIGDDDNTDFTIVENILITASELNFEVKDSYTIRVKTTTNINGVLEEVFVIGINDINEMPTAFTLSYDSIMENNLVGDTIGILSTIDEDASESFTYSLVETAFTDYASFVVLENVLYAGIEFDYEFKSEYTVEVKTTDLGGESYLQQFVINIIDAYEPITIVLSNQTIEENKVIGTTLGMFTNVDGVGVYSYSLVLGTGDDNNSDFVIVLNELQSATDFDYETITVNPMSVLVKSEDAFGNTEQQQFSIEILNVNEATAVFALSYDSIMENNLVGDTIGIFSTMDEDTNESFAYSLVETPFTDYASFAIVNGALRTFIVFDYETKSVFNIDVMSTDNSGATIIETFDVFVKDDTNEISIGVAEVENTLKLKAYPNPSSGAFVIQNLQKEASISVYNLLGSKVNFERIGNTISLANTEKGIYFITIETNGTISAQRIIVE